MCPPLGATRPAVAHTAKNIIPSTKPSFCTQPPAGQQLGDNSATRRSVPHSGHILTLQEPISHKTANDHQSLGRVMWTSGTSQDVEAPRQGVTSALPSGNHFPRVPLVVTPPNQLPIYLVNCHPLIRTASSKCQLLL